MKQIWAVGLKLWAVESLQVGMDDQGNNMNWYYVEIFFFFLQGK